MEESIDLNECIHRQQEVKKLFDSCRSAEERYETIISLGRRGVGLQPGDKTEKNQVEGCQSVMYMISWSEDNRIFFAVDSEALVSSGLAQLLIQVYSGLTAETILKCAPTFLDELDISASVTPSRVNGLYSVHLRMKQEALRHLMKKR